MTYSDPTSENVEQTEVAKDLSCPTVRRMRGVATQGMGRPDGGYFDVPLITPVLPSLWQGGCVDGVALPDDFTHVVSLYPWEKYALPEGCERVEFRQYDAAITDPQPFHEAAALVDSCYEQGGKTLVHCQAGLNRSALVAGIYLIEFQQRKPAEAVELLRDKRSPMVLCNQDFEAYLLSL